MEITSINAEKRFDIISFDNVVDGLDIAARSIFTVYTCPRCNEKIWFQRSDFEKVWKRRDWSNLPQEVARYFEEFASEQGLRLKFLDWQCPKCSLAARVLVECWAGGRHGDYGFELRTVLESFA